MNRCWEQVARLKRVAQSISRVPAAPAGNFKCSEADDVIWNPMKAPASKPFAKPSNRMGSFRFLSPRPKDANDLIERDVPKITFQRTENQSVRADIGRSCYIYYLHSVSFRDSLFVKPICNRAAGLNCGVFSVKRYGFVRY